MFRLKKCLKSILILAIFSFIIPTISLGEEIRILSWGQGFAFPELFGTSGKEKTAVLEKFEKAEGVTVSIEWGDESSVRQKVLLDLMSQTKRYDVIALGTDGALQTFGYAGFLEEVGPYLKKSEFKKYSDLSQYYPTFVKANTVDNKLYGLPYFGFGPGIIYRADLFKKYDVKVPKTMKELEAALEKLKQGFKKDGITDIYPLTMRGAPGEEPALDLAGFVYAYAGYPAWFEHGAITPEEIRAKKAKPIFTGDFRPGFEAFVRLAKNYGSPGIATHTWVDMMNLYAQGKVAVLLPSSVNGYAGITSTKNPDVAKNSAFAPMVVGPSGKQANIFWSWTFGVPSSSKHKTKAVKLLTFLTGKRSIQAFVDRIQWPVASMPSVMNSPVLIKRWGKKDIKLNEEGVANTEPHYFPYIPELSEFMEKIGTAASKAISTGEIDKSLDELQLWALERMNTGGYYK